MKATNEQIVAAYREFGSVWRAGKHLGMAGQSVHARLVAIGYPLASRRWSDDEIAELEELAGHETIGEIARRLGRPYAGVALMISRRSIGSRYGNQRQRKLPRAKGYDKANTVRLAKDLVAYDGSLRSFCIKHGLTIDSFARALQLHAPGYWVEYARERAAGLSKECPYCGRDFFPMTGKQVYCERTCAESARRDASYFGGNRRETIGLAERICQLCGRRDAKGLSSHHMLGKENDQENAHLVALCPGCHRLVGVLASRSFADESVAWENLINLSLIRRHGAEIARDGGGFLTTVRIEVVVVAEIEEAIGDE